MTLKIAIEKLMYQENLNPAICEKAIQDLFSAETNPLQIAAFLVLLHAKTETIDELATMVSTIKKNMIIIPVKQPVLDIVGTGGDGAGTINISTGSAILAASAGIKVAKHGNRAVSSRAGSADVLEALGVAINLTPQAIQQCIDEIGIGFCFSPKFHPIMQTVRHIRKQLTVPTSFNLIGPLLNPANAEHILLGVYDKKLMLPMAKLLNTLGTKHSMIAYGNGLDEVSCISITNLIEIKQGEIITTTLDPRHYRLSYCQKEDLRGGDAITNANILRETFLGKRGPVADTLILNAALALYLYGHVATILEGVESTREHLYAGSAHTLLQRWIEFSHDQQT